MKTRQLKCSHLVALSFAPVLASALLLVACGGNPTTVTPLPVDAAVDAASDAGADAHPDAASIGDAAGDH